MKNLIKKKKGEFSFITWIKKRIENNLNFISLFQGPPGIGKSWSALTIAYYLDPEFDCSQVAFDFLGVMQIINSPAFKKKKFKVIVFDEAQTSISNRKWQSLTNQLMSYLLSTFRHQNIVLLFTSPYADFLDSHSKKLLHCIFDCRGTNLKKKTNRIRPLIQQYNPHKQKFYQHSLWVNTSKGMEKLIYWSIPKPPMELVTPYEIKKTKFTDKLNADILQQLSPKDEDTRKPLTDIQEEVMVALAQHDGNIKAVAKALDRKPQMIYNHKKLAEKKKFKWEEFL